ncbi:MULTISPECIES: primosomal protein N' [Sporosarcina]|uniref:primosomal protein N' n=1 Tax=Sporosarcina TaxID=1569 RepID=UPI00058FF70B|nr:MULTISPECIES: primosomal protein N' [Sporosarcina]WJY28787.1 primosomal protein N' [Sporosarcina sp. 0.2-SM1T-5]
MIAEVIVDVAAYPIDRPFDYKIPELFRGFVEPGMRVKVPFGPRKVAGYVVGLKETSGLDETKLKSVEQLIDFEPVLSPELLEMSKWLAEDTLAYRIDALQVMLPAAMRAKYEKFIVAMKPDGIQGEALMDMMGGRERVPLKMADTPELLKQLKAAAASGAVRVETLVKQQTAVKKVRMITIQDAASIEGVLSGLSRQAAKQRRLLEWMLSHAGESMEAGRLLKEADVTATVLKSVIDKGAAQENKTEVYREPEDVRMEEAAVPRELTAHQQEAVGQVTDAFRNGQDSVFLLHGITGSGKTEVYLQTIEEVVKNGREAIVLVPEISLTPQMTSRFKERFDDQVAVMHSALSAGEKYDEWRRIHRKEVKVVVGARSAVFAPFENLGIIILDEEHESTYKQEDSPRYHARDVAIWRAAYNRCPVILGSATPALESYARASKGLYHLLELPVRVKELALPSVHVVDMRNELKEGNRSMFSVPLAEAIRERLDRHEQTVLFLNKRGFSSFVLCRDCGTTIQCPNCDISLTYHRASESLKCHYCGHEDAVPQECPECGSEHIRFFGTGTQKAEEEIGRLFPEARVLRMDVDTTRQKGSHARLLQKFGEGKADILLGTQMIAKGLDFPNITLVGVLAADTTLHLADFRAAEKTFQLLTQVSGRAGRHELEGEVFIQTYTPEHYAIELSKAQLYEPFYAMEMGARKQFGYPPFYYIVNIQFSHENLLKVVEYAEKAARFLTERLSPESVLIGPTASAVSRVNNRYRYQCLIKYKKEPKLTETLQALIRHYRTGWIKDGLLLSVDKSPVVIY